MRVQDRKQFKKLPKTIKIYRGCIEGNKKGFSWTIDRGKAIFFARRFESLEGHDPILLIGTCDKSNVIGFLNELKEKEIVIDPGNVRYEAVKLARQR